MPSPSTLTSSSSRPWVESYLSRWALVAGGTRSLTATKSMSAPGLLGRPEEVAADAAEAVDADANCHVSFLSVVSAIRPDRPGLPPIGPGRGPARRAGRVAVRRPARRARRPAEPTDPQHHVGIDAVGDERVDVGGDVVARGLGVSAAAGWRRRPSGPGWRPRASRMVGHGDDGQHAGEQRAGAEHDLVGGGDGVERRRGAGGVGRHQARRGRCGRRRPP